MKAFETILIELAIIVFIIGWTESDSQKFESGYGPLIVILMASGLRMLPSTRTNVRASAWLTGDAPVSPGMGIPVT